MANAKFKKAERKQLKLRMAIDGPSGSGKTYTALKLAHALVGEGGKIAVVDTEHKSAEKYVGVVDPDIGRPFEFDVAELGPPFTPESYVDLMTMAYEAGYDVLIVDSATHEWSGQGGILQIVDEETLRSNSRNNQLGWKAATPRHDKFVDAVLRNKCHLIVTIRSKQEYATEKDDRTGKTTVRKLGMAPIQRDQFEYEFDVFADMDLDHNMTISKTRCNAIDRKLFKLPGRDLAAQLAGWLSDGKPYIEERSDHEISELVELAGGVIPPEMMRDKAKEISGSVSNPRNLSVKHLEELKNWVKTYREGNLN